MKDIKRLSAQLNRSLTALALKAVLDGDRQAAELVVQLAAQLCEETANIACSHHDLADSIARKRTSWPILCDGTHPDYLKRNLRWLKALPIGEDSGWVKANSKKPYSLNTVANSNVNRAVQWLILMRSLPGGKHTDPISFSMVWAHIIRNGPPESNPQLRPLGLPFAEKKRDSSPQGGRAYESNVRDGIRQRLRASFRAQVME